MQIPKGVGGQHIKSDFSEVTNEDIMNELSLITLGDFEPLDILLNVNQYKKEIALFENDWVEYLPKEGRVNNRHGLSFTTMPGGDHMSLPSLGEICFKEQRKVSENEMCEPTELYHACESLHPWFNLFPKLGRTFVVRCGLGGYFPPHRDWPALKRDSFRLIAFMSGCGPYDYDWIMNDQKMMIEPGRVYYVNTRKTHRTMSWHKNSQHIIMNIPMTTENIAKTIAHYQHRH